ncbi:MAG: AAA family ATPase [Salinivirgaceae bacterium]|nr:AAA family ATPase [Salinivirgaceae bacterium]
MGTPEEEFKECVSNADNYLKEAYECFDSADRARKDTDRDNYNNEGDKKLELYCEWMARARYEYCKALANKFGKEEYKDDKKQAAYSNLWYFVTTEYDFLNPLTKAFLGDIKMYNLQEVKKEKRSSKNFEKYLIDNDLNDQQKNAIKTALEEPITIIQGPPGTGKTKTIFNLIACIKKLGRTVAMVSSNNLAIKDVEEKIEKYEDLNNSSAFLGNKHKRTAFNNKFPDSEKFQRVSKNYEYNGNVYEYWKESKVKLKEGKEKVFLEKWPIVTSTIQSLKSLFVDGDYSRRYDYVIIDEASLITIDLGILAMTAAHRLVIVGDDNQLPPVVDSKILDSVNQKYDIKDVFSLDKHQQKGDTSFMKICEDVFNKISELHKGWFDIKKICLNQHYRCHPAIIGFCNEYVYNSQLDIMTKDDGNVPIRVRWFDGNHCENYLYSKEERVSKVNYKQIRILIEEEFDSIIEDIRNGKSVCIMTPFVGQLEELKKQLNGRLDAELNRIINNKKFIGREGVLYKIDENSEVVLNKRLKSTINLHLDKELLEKLIKETVRTNYSKLGENESFFFDKKNQHIFEESFIAISDNYKTTEKEVSDDTEEKEYDEECEEKVSFEIDCLTIHKSQGSEYDVVYFLPVEDNEWEWPWSQKKRLVNVAVSRAKEKLVIITSTNLMTKNTKDILHGEKIQNEDNMIKKDSGDEMFVQKLVDYVFNKFKQKQNYQDDAYGFHKSKIVSVFDHPVKREQKTESESDAEETILELLKKLKLHYKQQVELSFMISDKVRDKLDYDDYAYIYNRPSLKNNQHNKSAAYDFVIYSNKGKKKTLFAIEVDGEQHRAGYTDVGNENNDKKKDRYMKLKSSQKRNEEYDKKKNSISSKGKMDIKLLRLSTSGQRHTLDGEDYDVDVKDMDGKTSIEEMIIRRLVGDLTCSATSTKKIALLRLAIPPKRGMMNI